MNAMIDDSPIDSQLFELNENQQKLIKKTIIVPKLINWIQQCINEENFSNDAKETYQKILITNNISEIEWENSAIDFYYQSAKIIAEKSSIPSIKDMTTLYSLKEFLNCNNNELINKVHLELFGLKYSKAIEECMTPTGVLTDDYYDSLNRLRERLGLNLQNVAELLSYIIRNKLNPIFKKLLEEYKSVIDPLSKSKSKTSTNEETDEMSLGYVDKILATSQKSGGGPNVYMREVLNLIDFYISNYNFINININDYILNDEMLPVTANNILSKKESIELFQHYLLTSITELSNNQQSNNELSDRYIQNEVIYGKLLGFNKESQNKVKESLSYQTIKKLTINILNSGLELSDNRKEQMKLLQNNLGLSDELNEEIFHNGIVSGFIEYNKKFFNGEKILTARDVELFRKQVS